MVLSAVLERRTVNVSMNMVNITASESVCWPILKNAACAGSHSKAKSGWIARIKCTAALYVLRKEDVVCVIPSPRNFLKNEIARKKKRF